MMVSFTSFVEVSMYLRVFEVKKAAHYLIQEKEVPIFGISDLWEPLKKIYGKNFGHMDLVDYERRQRNNLLSCNI